MHKNGVHHPALLKEVFLLKMHKGYNSKVPRSTKFLMQFQSNSRLKTEASFQAYKITGAN